MHHRHEGVPSQFRRRKTGTVEPGDLGLVLLHWGNTTPVATATAAVFEPSTAALALILLALATAPALQRGKR